MKRKQLIKRTRDIPDEAIERFLTHGGQAIADYFLVRKQEHVSYQCWSRDGKQQFVFLDDDEERAFAITQYLSRHGATVYEIGHVPETRPEPCRHDGGYNRGL